MKWYVSSSGVFSVTSNLKFETTLLILELELRIIWAPNEPDKISLALQFGKNSTGKLKFKNSHEEATSRVTISTIIVAVLPYQSYPMLKFKTSGTSSS